MSVFDIRSAQKQSEIEAVRKDVKKCSLCKLRAGCRLPVPSDGDIDAKIVLVGEAPGISEDKAGKPFIGPAGWELNNYLRRIGLSREDCYITNIVKCHPTGNRDPKQEEIEACSIHFNKELELLKPDVFVALGKFAAYALIGDWCKIETYHGIPFDVNGRVVIPIYHPAAGLHNSNTIMYILDDFDVIKKYLEGKVEPRSVIEEDRIPIDYRFARDSEYKALERYLAGSKYISIDTETTADGIYCMSVSVFPGTAYVIEATELNCINVVKKRVRRNGIYTIIHNALFDLPVLESIGIVPSNVIDTMILSYHLQKYPQGLKPLCSRLFGIPMTSYSEIVESYTNRLAYDFTIAASEYEWPETEKFVYQDKNGDWKEKKPHGLNTRIKRMLTDYNKSHCSLYERWKNYDREELSMVESVIGIKLREADLSDVVKEDSATVLTYSAKDADCALRVYTEFEELIDEYDMNRAVDLDHSILPIISDMQRRGMLIDIPFMKKLGEDVTIRLGEMKEEVCKCAGMDINPASPDQVSDLLFNKLKLQVLKKTDNGLPSTSASCLKPLRSDHPVVEAILGFREALKLRNTYIYKLIDKAEADSLNRVHPNIRMTRTATGRLATANPNLQAIPTRTKEGKKVREGFIAEENCVLMTCDYSQIEMRMVAHLSNDQEMLSIFSANEDLHKITASKVFGVPVNNVDEQMRYIAKRVGFGVLYGLGPQGLFDQFTMEGIKGWTLASCESMIQNWFSVFNGVARYFEKKRIEAKRYGYVREDLYGRIRFIPEVRSANKAVIQSGERRACSMAIQGAAQQVMKTAMRDLTPIYKNYNKLGISCHPLIQIHDDIVWEVEDNLAEDFAEDLKNVMRHCIDLTVPLDIDVKVGFNWGELVKEEDFFLKDYIEEEDAVDGYAQDQDEED